MFKKLIIGTALIVASTSYAGQDGNGGFGLKCGNKYELLDLYEARELHGYTVDLGPVNLSVDQKIEIMLKRLERTNSKRANEYRAQYAELEKISGFLDGKIVINNEQIILDYKMIPTLDVGETIIPENCTLVPFARNISLDNPAIKKEIFFYKKYWDLLDNNNRAALILHEIDYRYRGSGNNSTKTRNLIAILSSKDVESLNLIEMIQLLIRDFELLSIEVNGFRILDQNSRIHVPSLKLSHDGSYIEKMPIPAWGVPTAPYDCKQINLLGQKVCLYLPIELSRELACRNRGGWSPYKTACETGFIDFLNKDLPSVFGLKSGQLLISTKNGTIEFTHGILKLRSTTQVEGISGNVKVENEHFTAEAKGIYINTDQTIRHVGGAAVWVFKNGSKLESSGLAMFNHSADLQLESIAFDTSPSQDVRKLLEDGGYTYKGKNLYTMINPNPYTLFVGLEIYPNGRIKSLTTTLGKKEPPKKLHFDPNGKVVKVESAN